MGWRPDWRLACAVLLTGVTAGGVGALLTLLLHAVQHLAYGYDAEAFVVGSRQAPGWRRLVAMTAGGALVGLGWWALRRLLPEVVSVTAAVADPARPLRLRSATPDAVLQILAVGAGASLGREGAPRQLAAAVADQLGAVLRVSAAQRRSLVAVGAGAGLAAVYDVPLGGALFSLEVLLRSAALADVLPALVAAAVATVVAWPVVGAGPTYALPHTPLTLPLVVGSVLLGPLAGLAGEAFRRLTTAARAHPPRGWRLPLATTAGFAAVGALAWAEPLVLGNGKGPASLAFTGGLAVGTLGLLVVLKPLATAVCLRSGAVGGLLTPSVALGAVLGALAGHAEAALWPGAPVGALAVVGAGALLAVTQRAPLTAVVLALEFTDAGVAFVVPLALCTGGALVTAALAAKIPAGQPGDGPQ